MCNVCVLYMSLVFVYLWYALCGGDVCGVSIISTCCMGCVVCVCFCVCNIGVVHVLCVCDVCVQ